MKHGKAPRSSLPRRQRRGWREWRHTRPFWGGLLVIVGGAEVLLSERAPLPLIIHIGAQGLAGYFIPLVSVLAGMLVLFNPEQRTFYSLLAIVLALGSWITSNLGGFFVGMILGVIGGSLAFAWKEREEPEQAEAQEPPRSPRSSVGLALFRPVESEDDPPSPNGPADDSVTRPNVYPSDDETAAQATASRGTLAMMAAPVVPLGLSMLAILVPRSSAAALLGNSAADPGTVPSATLAASLSPSSSPSASPSDPPTASGSPTPTGSSSPSPTPTPTGTSSPTPTGSASPTPTSSPSHSPSPIASPSKSPSPTPTRSPSPKPSHTRHAPYSGTLDLAATAQVSLTAGLAKFSGVTYDGIAKVPSSNGVTPMLKFTMSALVLSGDTTLTMMQDGHTLMRQGWSVELSGNVQLFVTKISGRVHGDQVAFTVNKPPSQLAADLTLIGMVADQPLASAGSLLNGGWQI
jgi:hypothetical protein